MDDATFTDAFEAGTIPPASFSHRDHLRITWIYLERHGRDGALQRLVDGLRAFAVRAGKPDKFDLALTIAWVDAMAAARRDHPGARSLDELTAVRPDLLDRSSVRRGAPQV